MDNANFLNNAACACPTIPSDYPDWHRGREQYAVWLLLIDDPRIQQYIAALRAALADILWPAEQRALHITLQAAGFPSVNPVFDDDVALTVLEQQAEALSQIQPFQLHVGGINAFASALYLPVIDSEGGLARTRAVLNRYTPEIASAGYTPHITVGLFKPVAPVLLAREQLWQRLQDIGPMPSCQITVEQITLAYYQARELQGPLTPVQQIPLTTK